MSYTGLIVGSCIYPILGIIGYIIAHVQINKHIKDRNK